MNAVRSVIVVVNRRVVARTLTIKNPHQYYHPTAPGRRIIQQAFWTTTTTTTTTRRTTTRDNYDDYHQRRCWFSTSSSSTSTTTNDSKQNPNKEPVLYPTGGSDCTAADADVIAAAAAAACAASKAQQPRPIFPWRHETLDNPLPRLTPNTPEFLNDIVFAYRGQAFLASLFLNMPFWQIWIGHKHWRHDLADASGWAFAQGVAGILSNVYSVEQIQNVTPQEEEEREEKGEEDNNKQSFSVDFLYPNNTKNNDNNNKNDNNYQPTETNKSDINDDTDTDIQKQKTKTKKEQKEHKKKIVSQMLSRPLRHLYQSAHESGKDQLQIRLQMEPIRAILYSIFCYPYVTKDAVERDPKLLDRMRKMLLLSRTHPVEAFGQLQEYIEHEMTRHNKLETTVELQVLVECNEIFQVTDQQTGVVVQGSNDGKMRNVMHVVRFETTVTSQPQETFPYLVSSTPGNWQITDIDDLLDSVPWYAK